MLSSVTLIGGFSGLIASQGDLGETFGSNRIGGVTVYGPVSGTIVTLGKLDGDVRIFGGLAGTASIVAAQDIVGDVTIYGGISAGSSIVSGGSIGSSTFGTRISVQGTVDGLIASAGALKFEGGSSGSSHLFADSAGTPNQAAIDAVLSGGDLGSGPIRIFDMIPDRLDRGRLDDLLEVLARLHIGKDGRLTNDPGV